MTYNTKTGKEKILRKWITIIRHGGSGHEVQESWPYLSNATPWIFSLFLILSRRVQLPYLENMV